MEETIYCKDCFDFRQDDIPREGCGWCEIDFTTTDRDNTCENAEKRKTE